MVRKYLKQLNSLPNLICGGLLLILFISMCITSYKDNKQKEAIPERIEELEKKVKELAKKAKKKYEEPLPYEPTIKKEEIPEVIYRVVEVPVIQQWDNYTMCSGTYIY